MTTTTVGASNFTSAPLSSNGAEMEDRFSNPSNGEVWRQYRRILSGENRDVVREHLRQVFKDAFDDGAIPVRYGELLEFILSNVAGSFEDPPIVTTGGDGDTSAVRSLFRRWRPMLDQNWRLRASAGSSFLHLAYRGGRLELDHIYGDQVKVWHSEDAPSDWFSAVRVDVTTPGGGKISYRKDPDGQVFAVVLDKSGEPRTEPEAMPWGFIPVYPSYRRFFGELLPPPNSGLLDLHLSIAEMLSHLDHRRMYRVDKVIVSNDQMTSTEAVSPVEMKMSLNQIWETAAGERVSVVAQSFESLAEMNYVEQFARFTLMLLGIPPEVMDNRSRAETGAAKAEDSAPIREHQARDRQVANEWLLDFIDWARPAMEWTGMIAPSFGVTITVVPPRRTLPSDLQSWAQGTIMAAELGMLDLAREYAEINRIGVGLARTSIEKNVKFYRKLKQLAGGTNARVPMDTQEAGPEENSGTPSGPPE